MLHGQIELYIQYRSMGIYYINLNTYSEEPDRDIQLFAGYLNAENSFLDFLELGMNEPFIRIIRGNAELRLHQKNHMGASLVLKNIQNLDDNAYRLLSELVLTIMNEFETKYMKEIEEFMDTGGYTFERMKDFIIDEVNKMKAHMFSAYILEILGQTNNQKIMIVQTQDWMEELNQFYRNLEEEQNLNEKNTEIRKRIMKAMKTRIKLRRIIDGVNEKYKRTWELFSVPQIEIDPKDIDRKQAKKLSMLTEKQIQKQNKQTSKSKQRKK